MTMMGPDLYQTYLTLLLINLVHCIYMLNSLQLIVKVHPQAINSFVKFSAYLCVA